ncbi:GSCFA domain-containing protein [Alphaproteobacteria bacterium]|nr:GSCFA domain-containing protein [Alphaproteobacteria bacterium]
MSNNPYLNLPDYHFWSKSISEVHPSKIDPVVKSFRISRSEKIATMGSCFAQNLSNIIKEVGFNFFVPEGNPGHLSYNQAKIRQYGAFSARFGNVYTTRQALQLFERAFGTFKPDENIWKNKDKVVDAFRPTIEPNGFSNSKQLLEDREQHLFFVREMFEKMDVFIFTLGLTEAWTNNNDGSIYPLAPGVRGGSFDRNVSFINFSLEEVKRDLENLIGLISQKNNRCKIILTVSPVPLIATYEDRSVLVSTCYSKAVLRVACDEIEKKFKNVTYFPSFEIITSPANSNKYFQEDLRQVTEMGVMHVMNVFKNNFLFLKKRKQFFQKQNLEFMRSENDIHCDEEFIEEAIINSGLKHFPKD